MPQNMRCVLGGEAGNGRRPMEDDREAEYRQRGSQRHDQPGLGDAEGIDRLQRPEVPVTEPLVGQCFKDLGEEVHQEAFIAVDFSGHPQQVALPNYGVTGEIVRVCGAGEDGCEASAS